MKKITEAQSSEIGTVDVALARALVNLAKGQPLSELANLSKEDAQILIEFFRQPLPGWVTRKP